MKTKNVVSQKKEPPKQPLSKDELIQLFMASAEECHDLANDMSIDTIPVLLFLRWALDQDDLAEFDLKMPNGSDHKYCHVGNGIGPILGWLAENIHEKWNEVDASHMKVFGAMRAIKEGRQPVRGNL